MDVNFTCQVTERLPATVFVETATIAIVSLMILVCNLGNIIILRSVTFWHKSTVYFLMNLAISDICVALFTTSAIYPSAKSSDMSLSVCEFQAFLGGTSITVSLITMAYISVDRYIIIAHPLHHQSIMSRRTITVMVAISWAFPVILYSWVFNEELLGTQCNPDSFLCSADLTGNVSFVLVLILVIFIPTNVTIVYCYGTILFIARKHSSSIGQVVLQKAQLNPGNVIRPSSKRKNKAARMFIAIFGMFNLCWAPYVILVIYRVVSKTATVHWINFVIPWMAMSNSFVNIFIYFAMNVQYRRLVKKMFCCCKQWLHVPATEGYSMESQL